MQRRSWLCQSITGAAIPACSITVYTAGTTTKATIYGDQAGSSALGNPITAGSDGTYTYYAPSGRYTEVLSASGFTFGAAQTQDFILHDPFAAPGVSPNIFATTTWLNATPNCTNVTPATAGQTWCFDQTLRGLKVYDGTKFATVTTVNTYVANVKDFGAKGDSVTDDTTAIQSALNAATPNGTVVFPPGTYRKSGTLNVGSYTTISGYGANITELASVSDQIMGFSLSGKTRITILGLIYDGNRSNRTQGGTPQAFGIYVANSSDVTIRDVIIQNSLWDGIELAYTNSADATTRSNNILIQNTQVNNASRNGLSIDGAYDVSVIRSRFTGSDTNAPRAGIDVEADNGTIYNDNIWFFGVDSTGNTGNGLTFAQFTRNSGVVGGRYTGSGAGYGIAINTAGAPDNLGVTVWYPDLTSSANALGAFSRLTANAAIYYFDTVTGTQRVNAGVAGNDWLVVPATANTANAIVVRDPSGGVYFASATMTNATLLFSGNASFTGNAVEMGAQSNKFTFHGGTAGYQWLTNDGNTLTATLFNGLQVGPAPSGGDPGTGSINVQTAYQQAGVVIATMVLTNASGTRTNVPHMVQDTVTLTGGTAGVALAGAAAFTNATSYTCVCDNDSAVLACRVVQNGGSGFTVSSGAGTDVVRFICAGS